MSSSPNPTEPRRFQTILAARSKTERPSDLEYLLRSECHTLRVVERLHGGAHLLLPKVGGSSLALRVYHECDEVLQEAQARHADRLDVFFQSFQRTAVFFILPTPQVRQAQLDNPQSFFQPAQQLAHPSERQKLLATTRTQHQQEASPSIFLVATAEEALSILDILIGTLQQNSARKAFWEEQKVQHFVPPQTGTIAESCRPAAAVSVSETLRQWGERFEVPDVSVLMSTLGTLEAIAAVDCSTLQELPLEDRTKRLCQAFFGPLQTPSTATMVQNEAHHSNNNRGEATILPPPAIRPSVMPMMQHVDQQVTYFEDPNGVTSFRQAPTMSLPPEGSFQVRPVVSQHPQNRQPLWSQHGGPTAYRSQPGFYPGVSSGIAATPQPFVQWVGPAVFRNQSTFVHFPQQAP